ncbi:PREDICTED: interleukin-1 receptor-associated kinase 1-binding protein 1 [Charadrius vociferus]|uniref:interleukin-1 receptor-associated kinase 1-binding protein 1 n=1 Tax=Charadrius vociferus TaxID=50402 RepID=UPI00052188D9|nr:PREDICTED: interleukin-1 receptor-associated kinase 1-binding protein 1 [Charadrius vociferus]
MGGGKGEFSNEDQPASFSLFFRGENSHASWMPFPSSTTVHQWCEILQPFNAPSQLSRLIAGRPRLCPSCSIIHHFPPVLSPPRPGASQHEDIPPPVFLGGAKDSAGRCQFCLLLSDQPMKEGRFHAPPRAKTARKWPSEQQDVLMAFPCLKKNYFWEGDGEEASGGEGRNGIPESVPWQEQEENMTVTEDFSRVENTYQMEAEVCIIFSDFGKMQNVCNLLIEKLGTSVTISPPHFYHTPEAIDTLRRQVCVAAVGNTHRKAQEVCRLFGQSLGKPLLIREEETKEWGGHVDSHLSKSPDSLTLQERIQNATAYASCRVFAVFEIKGKENRRNKLL